MSDILTERSAGVLRIQLNRPAKKNAMTSSMYLTLADLLEQRGEGRPDTRHSLARCRGFVLRGQ